VYHSPRVGMLAGLPYLTRDGCAPPTEPLPCPASGGLRAGLPLAEGTRQQRATLPAMPMPSPSLVLAAGLLALAACAPPPPPEASAPVRPGIEVLLDRTDHPLAGRRVGLITNHTGTDGQGRSTIDLLAEAPGIELVALFSPEHGIRGTAADGERIASETDPRTGLPIHSLYGETRKPTPEMMEGIEALAFDIQDVGARPYTYASTMALGMEAAAERGIPFVVLDRPNPIGGEIVEGGVLDPAFASFVGMYPIAARHGMTVGELALMYNDAQGIGADLTVIPAEGWRRALWFDGSGLPWRPPSPNLPRFEALLHYPGTVFFEGTNLSEGRGTDHPFEQTGAPWLDAEAVASEMNALGLPGVRFEAVRFAVREDARKYPGDTLPGVRLVATDREAYRPVATALLLIDAIRQRHPEAFTWSGSMDRLAGTDRLRTAVEAGTLPALLAEWDRQAEAFRAERAHYLLYP
jgi:uncharacterized protein YbbC (DUF1343 family)